MIAESRKSKLLTRELIKKAGIDSPSHQFTSQILNKLKIQNNPQIYSAPQIAPKKVWFFSILIILALCILTILFSNDLSGIKLFELWELPKLTLPEINFDPSEFVNKISGISIYILFISLIILSIWVFIIMDKVLKRVFN